MMSYRNYVYAVAIAALLKLASGQQMTITAAGFGPASGPRIVWTPPTAFAPGNFTLTSAASSGSGSRYVSFAFANAASMDFAQTVVDCCEINGVMKLGTSRNVNLVGTGRGNVNDAGASDQVTQLSAVNQEGVLTCQFSMNFATSLDVHVLLASGPMDPTSTVSSPKKQYHGATRYASANTVATPSVVAPAETSGTTAASGATATSRTTAKLPMSLTTGTSSAASLKIHYYWLVLFVLPHLFGASTRL